MRRVVLAGIFAVLVSAAAALPACSSSTGGLQGTSGDASTDAQDSSVAPGDGAATDAPATGFDRFQERNLADINMYRATLGIAPLKLDLGLCAFALAGSKEETMDHMPHAHFIAAGNSGALWMEGFVMNAGENQGDPNGWTVLSATPTTNELDQIDAIQKAMFDEGPGDGEAHGHYENMMDPAFDRVGVGLIEVDQMLYLTNDFSSD
jgi:hypothetical protein